MKPNQVISPRMRVIDIPGIGSYNMVSGIGTGGGKYARSAWAYACMRIRSRELANLPWRLIKNGEIVKKHPIIDMLTAFGKESNWVDAFAATEIDMLLHGYGFWLYDVDIIERLNAGTMKVKKDASGIKGFEQILKGKTANTFTRDELCYFREYHPETDLDAGTPVMEVCKLAVSQEYEASKYVEAFFKNDATPATLLTTEQTVSQPEMQKVLSWWEKRFRGSKNKGKVGFADRGLKADVLSSTLKDMALVEIRNQAREDICTAFEVPKILLSMEEATFANAQEARKYMIEDLIIPRSAYYAAGINNQLVQKIDPSVTFEFYPDELPILQENADAKWARLDTALERGIISDEFARSEMGWPKTSAPEEKEAPDVEIDPTLRSWKRKSVKAFKRGESADVEFMTDKVSLPEQLRIHDRLAQAESTDEILRAFWFAPDYKKEREHALNRARHKALYKKG